MYWFAKQIKLFNSPAMQLLYYKFNTFCYISIFFLRATRLT